MSLSTEEEKVLYQILQAIGELKTEVKAIKDIDVTANEARDIAKESLQSVRSAHHRIDEVNKDIDDIKKEADESKSKNSSKWEKLWERVALMGVTFLAYILLGHWFHF